MLPPLISLLTRSTSGGGRRFRQTLAACFCLTFIASGVRAQYRFDHWTADNGLPQNSVRDIVQTRDGYLWLATLDGLVRFDGVRFTVFNKSNSPGITNNRFTKLYEDAHGNLWASLESAGLTRLQQGRFATFTAAHGLPPDAISSIGGDGRGNLIVISGFVLYRWIEGRFQQENDRQLRPDREQTPRSRAQADVAVHLPFYSDGSKMICFVDGQLRSWQRPEYPAEFTNFHPGQDQHGNTWFSSPDGLVSTQNGRVAEIYNQRNGLPGKQPRLVFGQWPLQAVSTGANGSLWLTDLDSMQTQLVTRQPPEGLDISLAYADREGNYWFGTLYNGLYRARKQIITAYSNPQGLVAREIYPVLEDRAGDFWIGTAGNGLYRFMKGAFTNYAIAPNAADNIITAIHQDRAGRLWVNRGIRLEDGHFVRGISDEVMAPLGFVWTILEDRAGALWFGGQKGVVRYQNGAATLFTTKDGLAGDDTKVIIEDGEGGLWLGSYGGLTQFKEGKFTRWTEANGLPGNTIRALSLDRDGVLWIGTYDSGLGRFEEGRFTRYTTNDGLFDNGVFQFLEDGRGWCWLSCNRGIYRVRKQELNDFAAGTTKTINSISYGKSDGMLNVECNGGRWPAGMKARDGRLWFPTMGGLAVIDPATVTTNVQPPPVVIEAARIDNQLVTTELLQSALRAPNSVIQLAPNQNNFEIQYTALSFINSETLKFKYKLEGLDPGWVEAGTRRTAYYSYLPPGDYTFRIIAANRDGLWNMEGKSLRIRVSPPIYRTWWFLTLCALLLGSVVFAAFKYRIAQLEQRQVAQQAFSRQLIQSQESERKRIAAELHDSLSQNLVIIKNRAMISLQERDDPEHAFEQIEEIAGAADHALAEVREIAHNLRPYQIDRLGVTKAIEALTRKASTHELQFTATLDKIDSLLSPESEINLYRIIQECINNIVKHSQATRASVTIRRGEQAVEVIVQDNGRGFTPADMQLGQSQNGTGLGLAGIAERARILGNQPRIESAPGKGAAISLKIKLGQPN
jgi:signal transduction histidine kinase/ligand-binding sensor domain-containing protein